MSEKTCGLMFEDLFWFLDDWEEPPKGARRAILYMSGREEYFLAEDVYPLLTEDEVATYHTLNLLVGDTQIEGVGCRVEFRGRLSDIYRRITSERANELISLLEGKEYERKSSDCV